jgi:tRNA threonylcarbamoyladenosine biosynthesis protein TsaE
MRIWHTASAAETRALGAGLARELLPARCLLLFGDLGAGKTCFAQGVAAGLGLDPGEVQSPTFALLREHELPAAAGATGGLAHLDLYRLRPEEAAACGFEEVLLGPGVKIVEWAERLPFSVPGALALTLRELEDGRREIAEMAEPPASASN